MDRPAALLTSVGLAIVIAVVALLRDAIAIRVARG
jgi:hypothetical protein